MLKHFGKRRANTSTRAAKLLRRFRKDRKGVAAVEFALIAPLLVMVVFGVLEVGRALYVHATLQHSVEVVGRYAMVHTDAATTDLYKVAKAGGLDLVGGNGEGGSNIVFNVSYVTVGEMTMAVVTAKTEHMIYAPFFSATSFVMVAETRVPLI
jgi:Flp pilus assembly protein TadG